LSVLSFTRENISAKDFAEHSEPEVVQEAHDRQENSMNCQEGLEFTQFGRILKLGEDAVYHAGQCNTARCKPDDHAHDKNDCTRVLISRRVERLAQIAKHISQVMQVSNHGAKWNQVAKDVAEVQAEGSHMMQQHFLEVIHARVDEQVSKKVVDVVAVGVETVVEQAFFVL
jgi:hypothetical protein